MRVEHTSWFGRMAGAMGGACCGLLLLVAAFPLLAWNESNARGEALALDEGLRLVQPAPLSLFDSKQVGKLVHISGPVSACDQLADATFGIAVKNALALERRSEQFRTVEQRSSQTRKTAFGGEETVTTFSYADEWGPSPIDSRSFDDQRYRGRNPTQMRTERELWYCPSVALGPYRLPQPVVAALAGQSMAPVDVHDPSVSAVARLQGSENDRGDAVDADPNRKPRRGRALQPQQQDSRALSQVVAHGNALYTGNPLQPRVADERYSFAAAVVPAASVVGSLDARGAVQPFRASNGRDILLASPREEGPHALFEAAHSRNAMVTWALRGAGWLLMLVALNLIFRPLSVAPEVVPILGGLASWVIGTGTGLIAFMLSLALTFATVAVAWVAVRPLLSLGLLAAAAGATWLLFSMGRRGGAAPLAPLNDAASGRWAPTADGQAPSNQKPAAARARYLPAHDYESKRD